ncbi:MAG: PQQ-binding-like beta-propeller repeat protein [Bacteroidales bacterium]|nr:PQQ-binding-like beta-propeller repeat protein [Bacteroidales bacterium]
MRKKLTRTLSFVLMLVISWSISHAQVDELWKTNLSGKVLWQQVTSFGNYFICTDTEFAAFNPETGEKLWSNSQFANIANEQIEEMSGSPLLSITLGDVITLLDPFTGNIKFNSSQAGVADLKTKQVLYKANGILVAGKNMNNDPIMLMVDMATGKKVWQIEERFGRIVTLNELSDKELLIVTLFKNYKVNSQTGDIIWKNSISKEAEQLESMGAFGSLLQGVAEQAVADEDFVINFYKHPSKDIFIIGAENKNESQSSSGKTMISYENNYIAFNIADGSRLWTEPIQMRGQLGDLAFYKDGIIVLPNDGGRTKINFFDLETAIGKWGKKGRGISIKGGIYKHIQTKNGILLMSQSGEKNYLNFLDPAQGLITFEKPVRINGEVIRTIKSPKGILFITTKEINILNPTTGELVFDKSIQTNPTLLEQKENTIYAFDTKENIVKLIDIETATVKNVSSVALKFEGKEIPNKLELREKGIFVSSEQNVAMFDYSGSQLFQKYYEAPREPGLKRALLYAQAARAAYISANAYYASEVLQSAAPEIKEEDAFDGAIVEGFGQVYGELGDAASDFAKQSFQQANARFKATAEGRDFIIIFGKIEKDNTLLKVNKDTGEPEGTINLGKEKEPIYAVDDVTGQVFYKTNETQITSYKL